MKKSFDRSAQTARRPADSGGAVKPFVSARLLSLAAACLLCLAGTAHADYVIYVAEGGSGDGSATNPYGSFNEALDTVAAYRLGGGTDDATIIAGVGSFNEQLHLEAGRHNNVRIEGSTQWNLDAEGRPTSVAIGSGGEELATRIQYATLPSYGENYVVWVDGADDVTIEGVLIAADFGAPSPTNALAIDRASGAEVSYTGVTGAFLGLHSRGAKGDFHHILAFGNLIGVSLEGGVPGEEGDVALSDSIIRANEGHGCQIVPHTDVTTPSPLEDESGVERIDVTVVNTLSTGNGFAGFDIPANLPWVSGLGHATRSGNPGWASISIRSSVAEGNALGLRIVQDNFGYSNFPENRDAAPTTMMIALDGVSLEGNIELAAWASAAGSPSLRLHVYDPSEAAASLATEEGHPEFFEPSLLMYNQERVAP